MSIERAALDLWLAMLASWYLASLWVSRARRRGSLGLGVIHFLGFALGFMLLFTPPAGVSVFGEPHMALGGPWRTPLMTLPAALGAPLLAVEAAAFAFGWWARIHIGELWSGAMVVREDHRVVDTGPYRLVRHPIYTAFITGAWAFAVITMTPASLAGAVVLTAVMAIKAKQEEAFLRRELGAGPYDAYAARTPMLVPFAPVRNARG